MALALGVMAAPGLAGCGANSAAHPAASTASGGTAASSGGAAASGAAASPSSPGAVATVTVTGSASMSPAANPSTTGASATTANLLSARIPSFCGMKAATLLQGQYPAAADHGSGSLDTSTAVAVDVNGDGGKELVAAYTCVPGTVSWPQYIVAVDASSNTVGWVQLNGQQEHGQMTTMSASGNGVRVNWKSYEGAGFNGHEHVSFISFQGGTGHLRDLTPASAQHTTVVTGVDTVGFASPTGLLLCNMRSDGVVCVETKPTFTIPGVEGDAHCDMPAARLPKGQAGHMYCDDDGDAGYVDDDKSTTWWSSSEGDGMVQAGTGSLHTLGYGHTLQTDWASCVLSATTGVTCRTLSGAHGFTLSAGSHRVW